MDAMVKLLYEKETIYDTDIDRLFEEAEGKSALSVAEEATEIVPTEDATEVAPTEDKAE